jgi:hypothetical protein
MPPAQTWRSFTKEIGTPKRALSSPVGSCLCRSASTPCLEVVLSPRVDVGRFRYRATPWREGAASGWRGSGNSLTDRECIAACAPSYGLSQDSVGASAELPLPRGRRRAAITVGQDCYQQADAWRAWRTCCTSAWRRNGLSMMIMSSGGDTPKADPGSPVTRSMRKDGRDARAASASWRPFMPGRPTSVISMSMRASDRTISSAPAPSAASSTTQPTLRSARTSGVRTPSSSSTRSTLPRWGTVVFRAGKPAVPFSGAATTRGPTC